MTTLEPILRRGAQLYQHARSRLKEHTRSHWEAVSRTLTPGEYAIARLDEAVDHPFPTSLGSLYAQELHNSLASEHGTGRYDSAFSHLLWLKPLGDREPLAARVDHVLSFQLDDDGQLQMEHHFFGDALTRQLRLIADHPVELPPLASENALLEGLRAALHAPSVSLEALRRQPRHALLMATGQGRLFELLRRWPEPRLPAVALDYLLQSCANDPLWDHALTTFGYPDTDRADRLSRSPLLERQLAALKDAAWVTLTATHQRILVETTHMLTDAGFSRRHVADSLRVTLDFDLRTLLHELNLDAQVRQRTVFPEHHQPIRFEAQIHIEADLESAEHRLVVFEEIAVPGEWSFRCEEGGAHFVDEDLDLEDLQVQLESALETAYDVLDFYEGWD